MTEAEQQSVYNAATERQTRRCEVIYTSANLGPLQNLASYLAFDTSLSTEVALAIIGVAKSLTTDAVGAEIVRQELAELAAHLDKPTNHCHERTEA